MFDSDLFDCRLPGRTLLIRQLREMFDCGERPDLEKMKVDVNTVASLLKQYLRELPEPIIPTNLYETIMKAVTRDMSINRDQGLQNLTSALQLMPSYNYNLLQYICKFLSQIHQNCDVNKMNDTNLATVFAQCVIRPDVDDPALLMGTAGNRSKVVLVLIQEVYTIFKIEYKADGTQVMVDNLLDIEESTSSFDVGAMTYFKVSSSMSQDGDLLSLDSDANTFTDSLPEPILPSNCCDTNDISDKSDLQKVSLKESHVEYEKECPSSDSSTSEDEPVFGSVRAGRLHSHQAASSNLVHDASHQVEVRITKSESGDVIPRPPVRRSKLLASSSQPAKDNTVDLVSNDSDDDLVIDRLTGTDLSTMTIEDIIPFLKTVFVELKAQRSKVKSLRTKLAATKEQHRKELEKVRADLYSERQATAKAVQKVVALQGELQACEMVTNQSSHVLAE